MKTLEQKLNDISPERQEKIRVRTRELVAREMSLPAAIRPPICHSIEARRAHRL